MLMFLIILTTFVRAVVLTAVSTQLIELSTLIIGAAGSSGMSVHTYQITQYHILDYTYNYIYSSLSNIYFPFRAFQL
jgi:hypothetical protein